MPEVLVGERLPSPIRALADVFLSVDLKPSKESYIRVYHNYFSAVKVFTFQWKLEEYHTPINVSEPVTAIILTLPNMSSSTSIKTSTIVIASTGAIIAGFLGMYPRLSTSLKSLHRYASMLIGLYNLGYAVYFDHKRRTDPEFRKALKRESRREARAAKEEAEAQGEEQKQAIRNAVNDARDQGFPTDVEDKEAYFMEQVGQGEMLLSDSMCEVSPIIRTLYAHVIPGSRHVDAALCFYKALKVYPSPKDLMSIYDKTVSKPVIDILAEMMALDPTISVGSGSGPGSATGIDD